MTTATDTIHAGTTDALLGDEGRRVDAQRSEIGFAVKDMWGLRTVHGVFGAYDGDLTIHGGRATGRLTIDAASVDTKDAKRDRHLRSADFFDVERHPQIVFTVTAVTAREDGLTVTGHLAIGATQTRLEIPATVGATDDGAIRLDGTTTISREAAGLSWNKLGMIRGDVTLHARLTLERAAS